MVRDFFVLMRGDLTLRFQIPQRFDLRRLIVVAVIGADD
jgi:hypothetical protein